MICDGPRNAKIIALGQTPGPDELRSGRPFSGVSGWEWDKMLKEAGLSRSTIFSFNVVDRLPPAGKVENFFAKKREADKLGLPWVMGRRPYDDCIIEGIENVQSTIAEIQPNIIIALGDLAMWALTGESGITKWRGSVMESNEIGGRVYKVIPTFNPAFISRNWPTRWIGVQDHRRILRESFFPEIKYPKREYLIRPTLDEAIHAIERAKGNLTTNDLETRGGQIACVGIGYSSMEAACIPLICSDKPEGYWSAHEEHLITTKLKEVLTHPETQIIFQHGHFDAQMYIAQWGYIPNVTYDTMIAQHVCYADMRKSLALMASLYCKYYKFWKDDGKEWDPDIHSDEDYWTYNCDDLCYTYEVHDVQKMIMKKRDLENAFNIQMRMFLPTLKMMLRGVNVDVALKERMGGELQREMTKRMTYFENVLGHPLNPGSHVQMKNLFYGDFQVKPYFDRKTKSQSLNDEGLEVVKKRKPVLRPLVEAVQEYRSLSTFKSNFAEMRLSPDERIRCSINMSFVKTFRLSTSENIWGEGRNLQNMSKGRKEDD